MTRFRRRSSLGNSQFGGDPMNGHLDEIRITVGHNRYGLGHELHAADCGFSQGQKMPRGARQAYWAGLNASAVELAFVAVGNVTRQTERCLPEFEIEYLIRIPAIVQQPVPCEERGNRDKDEHKRSHRNPLSQEG
ncbi:hypothetical protein EN745_31115 [Mesorhizobium sp. M4A.F.Ca.ET.022.05.2.1]|uniref:hypothetical protein n=1 Tax=Mesorhizobium sp. M4A.F.Ca.ET.022.05.2.1 TaxID=2496653 RepID=UPI000FCB0890|nr:hypothetical protein [Mesorhizobium sp. M4A.F.Ca.ET.022.05.2.1]RVC74052.1 hypothetical protein EN745_31115 [Mesorhizobium sp. M4A.F.Ca.ET.022.05.2.1]